MPREFSSTTAEQLLAAVEAVVVRGGAAEAQFVADFKDLTLDQANAALSLAVDMGFLSGKLRFSPASPLARFVDTYDSSQKAGILRIMLETYEPFTLFRTRLLATDSAENAAQQVKTLLDLDAHRQDIKDTLVSLGTFSRALQVEPGGRYQVDPDGFANSLQDLADACANVASAEARINEQLRTAANAGFSREDVIVPLSTALVRAQNNDPVGAVVNAANAVESFLDFLAAEKNVDVTGATGLNARLDKFQLPTRELPRKLNNVGKYLGHIRNAADHGTGDPDVGNASWQVEVCTGIEYVFVACSFIAACWHLHTAPNDPPRI